MIEAKSGSGVRPRRRARVLSKRARPAADDGRDRGIGREANEPGCRGAGHRCERIEHVLHRTVSAGKFSAVRPAERVARGLGHRDQAFDRARRRGHRDGRRRAKRGSTLGTPASGSRTMPLKKSRRRAVGSARAARRRVISRALRPSM